jgi:hypothetical protein
MYSQFRLITSIDYGLDFLPCMLALERERYTTLIGYYT